jgi:hypothetical protein
MGGLLLCSCEIILVFVDWREKCSKHPNSHLYLWKCPCAKGLAEVGVGVTSPYHPPKQLYQVVKKKNDEMFGS